MNEEDKFELSFQKETESKILRILNNEQKCNEGIFFDVKTPEGEVLQGLLVYCAYQNNEEGAKNGVPPLIIEKFYEIGNRGGLYFSLASKDPKDAHWKTYFTDGSIRHDDKAGFISTLNSVIDYEKEFNIKYNIKEVKGMTSSHMIELHVLEAIQKKTLELKRGLDRAKVGSRDI